MTTTKHSVSYKPFLHGWAVEVAKKHDETFWGEWEAQLHDDVAEWKGLTPEERSHITQILRLFTQSDCQVASNYCDMLLPRFHNHEIRQMLLSFGAREVIHQRAYDLLNSTLGLHDSEYKAFLQYDEMVAKVETMAEGDPNTVSGLAMCIVRSVINEGISLFSAFAMLLGYKKRGLMKGMSEIVEWSIRDETMHVEGLTRLFHEYIGEHPRVYTDKFKDGIYDAVRHAADLEFAVIDLSYSGGEVEGQSADEIREYVRFIADRRLSQLGLEPMYGVDTNPLPWLALMLESLTSTSFFEAVVNDYSADNLVGDWGYTTKGAAHE